MGWVWKLPLICVGYCVIFQSRLSHGWEQIALQSPGHHATEIYNISLRFDDLPTNKHGLGYHPTNPEQSALHYNSIYLQGFSIVDVSKASLPDVSDISCAQHSAPNALFGKVNAGYPWPRISINDLSKPYKPEGDHHLKSRRTFSLADMRLKPTGIVQGEPGKAWVVIQITLLKLPPDPLDGYVGAGSTAADIFPGLLHGTPVWTLRTRATLFAGFLPGSHVPIRLKLKQWLGADWGKGMDVLEMSGVYARVINETTNEWTEELCEFCVDDVVLEVTEQIVGEKREKGQDAPKAADARSSVEHGEVHYVLVKNDEMVADPTDPDYQQFKSLMSKNKKFESL